MAGTFWLTPPDTCEDPLKPLVHIHGDADGVVPFEGRQIRNTHQGSIFEALALYRAKGGFTGAFAEVSDDLSCSIEANSSAAILAFCQFPGGHDFKIKHLDYGWAKLTE